MQSLESATQSVTQLTRLAAQWVWVMSLDTFSQAQQMTGVGMEGRAHPTSIRRRDLHKQRSLQPCDMNDTAHSLQAFEQSRRIKMVHLDLRLDSAVVHTQCLLSAGRGLFVLFGLLFWENLVHRRSLGTNKPKGNYISFQ